MLDEGDQLGSYVIEQRLAGGGMATLFLARRCGPAGFERKVAIKVVHRHYAEDPSFVDMFLDEARLSARIDHPNVVHVEELGEVDGNYYLVMEYVRGCSLNRFARELGRRRRGLKAETAAYVVSKIAEGLHAAHETRGDNGELLQLVHRDVSPQNVLLSHRGQIKLIDFGIAKARGRIQETTGSTLKGKVRYMAPEQARGEPIDRSADVYALGVILWELLTQRRLFAGDNELEVLRRVQDPIVHAPSNFCDWHDPLLDEAILMALAPSVADRFRTADDFRVALLGAVPPALQVQQVHLGQLVGLVVPDLAESGDAAVSVDTILNQLTEDATGREIDAELVLSTPRRPMTRRVEDAMPTAENSLHIDVSVADAMSTEPRSGGRGKTLAALILVAALAAALGVGGWWVTRTPAPLPVPQRAVVEEPVTEPDEPEEPVVESEEPTPESMAVEPDEERPRANMRPRDRQVMRSMESMTPAMQDTPTMMPFIEDL